MPHDYESLLNPGQLRAVSAQAGPVLIIAGAGSGKTRVITFRIASLLEKGVPESEILAVTFTNKAAAEMRHRIRELTGKKLKQVTIATFHAFGLKILHENHNLAGYKKEFTIFDETDREALIKETAHEMKIDIDKMSPSGLAALFSKIKTGRMGWSGPHSIYESLYHEYNHSLKLFQAFDFDDLLVTPISLFINHPEVLARCQERYRYIMVDEFQDTSDIQYRFITLIAKKHRTICVVGDDDQSIYSFRGALFENLLRFESDFPGTLEIKLEQNYRSSGTILAAANHLITHNQLRKTKALWTSREPGEKITLAFPKTEKDEGDFIANEIRAHVLKYHTAYNKIGILVRTNHLTRSLEEALLANKIPYLVSGGMSFFSRKEVKDILSYLTVMVNPDDDVNLLRIINTPRRGIGKAVITELLNVSRKHSCSLFSAMAMVRFAEAQQFPPKARVEIEEFLKIIEIYNAKMKEKKGMAKGLRELIDHIDYWTYLLIQHKKEQVARFKYLNVESLVNSIADYEDDPDNLSPSLRDYLNRISLLSIEENKEEEEVAKVNLMTVHAAKGLEFDVVFIAAAEEGLFPHARTIEESAANIEEERRLFYVAITRAKRKLYITAAITRRRMGEALESSPSCFIEELPEELYEVYKEENPPEEEVSSYFNKLKEQFK